MHLLSLKQLWSHILKLRRRSTQREPPTMGKQLVNFTTCGFESSAPFFVIYKAMLLCKSYTCQLYIFLTSVLQWRQVVNNSMKQHYWCDGFSLTLPPYTHVYLVIHILIKLLDLSNAAPFFLIYKAMLLCNSYTYQLYIFFCFRTEVEMSGIAVSKYSTKKAFDKSSSFINICITRYTCRDDILTQPPDQDYNRNRRHTAYRQYILWWHGYLGAGYRWETIHSFPL
jgi:hypothetical protein